MRKSLWLCAIFCLFLSAGSRAFCQSPIPSSFFGFQVNQECDISTTGAVGIGCAGNPAGEYGFPGMPFAWTRSLGSADVANSVVRWDYMVQCDPTGTACPITGSRCSKDGLTTGGAACPTAELSTTCTNPSLNAPDDPTNCAYVWPLFDFYTNLYNSKGIGWMFELYLTPDYLSVRGSRCTGHHTATFGADNTCLAVADGPPTGSYTCTPVPGYGCDPPYDVDSVPGNGDGAGTDANLINFVTAMMTHMAANSQHIDMLAIWNEMEVCGEWNHTSCSSTSYGTTAQLVTMTNDARTAVHASDSSVPVVSGGIFGLGNFNRFLKPLLSQEAATGNQYDYVGFHGYYHTATQKCGGSAGCPVPEEWLSQWNELKAILADYPGLQTIDSEFSWGENAEVTDPDMREAQAARSYILQEQFYPTIQMVNWFGEDYKMKTGGGAGEFWSPGPSGTDNCTVADPVQGGFDCPAGLAYQQVVSWTTGTTFSACTCNDSADGNCSATPKKGTFSCTITRSSPAGYSALLVWDNTNTTFPCSGFSTVKEQQACGLTLYTVPAAYTTATSLWQDLDNDAPISLSGATNVHIGAKPVLLENMTY